MNQETKPFLVQLESFPAKITLEKKLEECRKQLNALELKVSRLEKQVEEQNQERKQ